MPIPPRPPNVSVKVPKSTSTAGTLPIPPNKTFFPITGAPGPATFTHTQSTASASWVINHNLGTVREPIVVLDSAPTEIAFPDATVNSLNQITLTFDSAVTGKAYL